MMNTPDVTVPDDTEVKRLMEQYHDRRAAGYDTDGVTHGLFSDTQRRAWQTLLARITGDAPLRVLDVGCGTGFRALLLAEAGHQVTGVDLTPGMLAEARRKAEAAGLAVTFKVGDAEAPPEADGNFDLVVARHLVQRGGNNRSVSGGKYGGQALACGDARRLKPAFRC